MSGHERSTCGAGRTVSWREVLRRVSGEISWGNNNRKGGGSDAEQAYVTDMPTLPFIGTLFPVSSRVCSVESARSKVESGGWQRRKSARMWERSAFLLVLRLPLALWEYWTNNGANAITSSVSLSGLSDRLNHQQSGMWVDSGTVGR